MAAGPPSFCKPYSKRLRVSRSNLDRQQRSGLERARELLRQGDVLVVWRLDRLGRSLKFPIELMSELER
jgi:DNA invertase Pin-like site-specific DNA recombinase